MNETQQLQEQINKLQAELSDLKSAFFKNNFSAYQAFNKSSVFSTALTVPRYTTLPTCEVGQICENSGKLLICSATDTWTVVGTQS
jgi:hypothetical protein